MKFVDSNKNRMVQCRLNDEQYNCLKEICKNKNYTMSKLLLKSLDYYINNSQDLKFKEGILMNKITKKQVKQYVRDFVDSKEVNIYNCGFYIYNNELKSFFNIVGHAHDSLYSDATYVVYVTDLIKDYFSNQDLKFTLSDLDSIFYDRINDMIEEFNEDLC
ncbi:hypothetical protein KGF42_18405 [Clostridioides sp. ZZV15-6383]|uniref:hypothetical protein n=1 Tax=Clostridioides sp. ZZV15-6383 TaxID=2811498 RepID=UPI001D11914A|nr:hypothetical protein [Clostridioides sp. ZZV15-6383]